jgi:Relaxase/Mobilisation nuclease domain
MIGSISQGGNFGGLFRYLLDPEKKAIIIGGNVASSSIGGLTREFQAVANLNPQVEVTVKHIALAFAPQDGEVARSLKEEIAIELLTKLGYENSQYIIVEHPRSDRDHNHDHMHIVANTVGLDGSRVKNGFEWRRTEKILREIEQENDLTPVACSWESKRSLPTKGQSERYRREVAAAESDPSLPKPELPVSTKLQDLIDEVISHSATMSDYVARLQSQGVEVRPKITRTGLVQGLSYSLDGVAFQGAHLQGCSFPKLQARGVSYERERDLPALSAVARGETLTLKVEPMAVEPMVVEREKISITTPEIEKFEVVNTEVTATEADGIESIAARSNIGQEIAATEADGIESFAARSNIGQEIAATEADGIESFAARSNIGQEIAATEADGIESFTARSNIGQEIAATDADWLQSFAGRSNIGQHDLDRAEPEVTATEVETIELHASTSEGVDPLVAAPQIFKFLQLQKQSHFIGSRYNISWDRPILKVTDKNDRILLETERHENEKGQVVWSPKPIPIDSPGLPAEMLALVVEHNRQQEQQSRSRLSR